MKSNFLQLLTAFAVFFVVAALSEAEYKKILEDEEAVHDAIKGSRGGRDLIGFGNMVDCAVRRRQHDFLSPVRSLIQYNNYGCWCGSGGAGRVVDPTDHCCKVHDRCYGQVPGYESYYTSYRYRCNSGGLIACGDNRGTKQRILCDCDKRAAECFAGNRGTYNFPKNVLGGWKIRC